MSRPKIPEGLAAMIAQAMERGDGSIQIRRDEEDPRKFDKVLATMAPPEIVLAKIRDSEALIDAHNAVQDTQLANKKKIDALREEMFDEMARAFGFADSKALHAEDKYVGYHAKTHELSLYLDQSQEREGKEAEAKKADMIEVARANVPDEIQALRERHTVLGTRQAAIRQQVTGLREQYEAMKKEADGIEAEYWMNIGALFGYKTHEEAEAAGMEFEVNDEGTEVVASTEKATPPKAAGASAN